MSGNTEDIKNDLFQAASYIKLKVPYEPKILIIGGSGLGILADTLEEPISLSYEEIQSFPKSPTPNQLKYLVFGTVANVKVVCMKGRFHYYEGLSLQAIIFPVRLAKLLGVELVIVTNAAGSCNTSYKPGDIMIIKDHINFLGFGGQNPLIGPNNPEFGERFFAVNNVYDREIRKEAQLIAKQLGLENNLHEGVYGMVAGPNYESVAEIKALRILGVDAVGMSTIPEVLAAAHAKMKVFGFSLISNAGIADYDGDGAPNHDEVLKTVNERAEQLKEFVIKIIGASSSLLCQCKSKSEQLVFMK